MFESNIVTPAHEFRDGLDYILTNKYVLLGNHFMSVAGVVPIVRPSVEVIW